MTPGPEPGSDGPGLPRRSRGGRPAARPRHWLWWPAVEPSGPVAARRSCPRPCRARSEGGLSGSCAKQVSADGGHVGEDPDAQNDDHAGRQLRANAQLIPEEDDEGGDDHVGQERDDKHLVVEDAVENGAHAAEDRVERGYHGDGQIRLQREGHRGVQEEAGGETDEQSKCGNHGEVSVGCGACFVMGAVVLPAVVGGAVVGTGACLVTADCTGLAIRKDSAGSPGTTTESCSLMSPRIL